MEVSVGYKQGYYEVVKILENRKIIIRCTLCGEEREVDRNNFLSKKSQMCKKCYANGAWKTKEF